MDLATLQARLVEAEAAYHALMTGESLCEILEHSKRMTYTHTNKAVLVSYMGDLRAQIARLQNGGVVTGRRGVSRAIFF